MIEIQVNNLVKSFEVGKNVLDGLTFQVDQGERVGLLGRNGAGKTTLFKILTGELDYDEGTVVVGQGRRVGLISQIPVYPAGFTVEDVLRSAFARLESLAEEMRALEARMAAGESDPAILKRYGTLSERFEAFGGYDTDVAVNKIANGLSIPDSQRSQLFDSLSGGEKTRVNLGRLILEDTDILLLDEPTNHLDLHATEWLEEYIRSFHGTVVTISHDRYFLDRTVTRPLCDSLIAVKLLRLCAFDCVRGVICQSLLLPPLVCRLRGVIGAKLAALVLPLFKKEAHIRIELRRALSIKGNRALPLLAAGRLLHIDLEVDALYRFQLKEEVHYVGKRPDLRRAGFIPKNKG